MFRILIVEDIRPTLDQLEKLLQEMNPATEVDGAETVDEARQMLVFRDREGETYDAAIVDFKLPMAPGENPEFDTTICDMVSERMPDALIVHITAYEDQKIVADHIRERHVADRTCQCVLRRWKLAGQISWWGGFAASCIAARSVRS